MPYYDAIWRSLFIKVTKTSLFGMNKENKKMKKGHLDEPKTQIRKKHERGPIYLLYIYIFSWSWVFVKFHITYLNLRDSASYNPWT